MQYTRRKLHSFLVIITGRCVRATLANHYFVADNPSYRYGRASQAELLAGAANLLTNKPFAYPYTAY